MKKTKTKVIFRVFKDDGDVIAIFPQEAVNSNPHECSSYQHVGQHGACDPYGIIQVTRAATPIEYKDLEEELVRCGYDLLVIRRQRSYHINRRRAIIKEWEALAGK